MQVNAQEEKPLKTKILGVQINPYAKNTDDTGWAAALRYSKIYKERLTIGSEIFGTTYDNPSYSRKEIELSLFVRYNIINKPKINYFIEASTSVAYGNWNFKQFVKEYSTNYPYFHENATYFQYFDYYLAPGIQIPFAKNKYSLDLMLKVSTIPVLFDSWNIAPTFKFNIHF